MSPGNADRRQILAAAAELESRLAALPAYSWERQAEYRAAVADLIGELRTRPEAQASIRERWDGAVIKMLGLRASSASGFAAAARNWIAQARQKVADR